MNDSLSPEEQRLADVEAVFAKQDSLWRQQLEELPIGGECRLGNGWKWTHPAEGQYHERGITHTAPFMLVRTQSGQYLVRREMLNGDKVIVWQTS